MMLQPVRNLAQLPAPLKPLIEIAYGLRWAWNYNTRLLFRRLDEARWEQSGHNPVLLLESADQGRLEAACRDELYMAQLERVVRHLHTYQHIENRWFCRAQGQDHAPLVAYFSLEFAITECLPIFSGGLGVLAGDHLKSASDLGLPLVAVGLLYRQGYFRQHLDEKGNQQEIYQGNDFERLPLQLEKGPQGQPLTIVLAQPDMPVKAQVWRAQVGNIPLYLLDADLPDNRPQDRAITHRLYGGDSEMRLRQEMLLGIGGYRALQALKLEPLVHHMNEGHAAFVALERILHLMETHRVPFAAAREAATAGMAFTTHTPVPAGHDYFSPELMDRYFSNHACALGLSRRDFLALGRKDPNDEGEHFCMTILALKLAAHSNAVSRLHGRVSRQMWKDLWPRLPIEEIPISHITNAVHFPSWICGELKALYDRHLGAGWRDDVADETVWQQAGRIPDEELWALRQSRRAKLVDFARRRCHRQLQRQGAGADQLQAALSMLDPQALTLGFARRFATYKRATLLLHDPQRLARLLNDPKRPVQLLFAGKAHPKDVEGKALMRQLIALAEDPAFAGRIVFLEDYDLEVARYMVQGVDVWVNTPVRPREASGTSGMKAAANGVLNMSTLDGWWDEAYGPQVGWAIGDSQSEGDPALQDQRDAQALYEVLEQEIVTLFYERDDRALPRRWIARMKAAMQTLSPTFNTHRMVAEYLEKFYLPAADRYGVLSHDGLSRAKALADWKARLGRNWYQIQVQMVSPQPQNIPADQPVEVVAHVRFGEIDPQEVRVQLYQEFAPASVDCPIIKTTSMTLLRSDGSGNYLFQARAVLRAGTEPPRYAVRVLPHHPDLACPFIPGLITWT